MKLSELIKELQSIQEFTVGDLPVFIRNQKEFGSGDVVKFRCGSIEVGRSISVLNLDDDIDGVNDNDEIILIEEII